MRLHILNLDKNENLTNLDSFVHAGSDADLIVLWVPLTVGHHEVVRAGRWE